VVSKPQHFPALTFNGALLPRAVTADVVQLAPGKACTPDARTVG